MPEYIVWIAVAFVVLVIVWVVFSKVLPKKKLQDTTGTSLSFDIDGFMEAVGGLSNIKESEATLSKVTLYVYDDTKIMMDQLKALGASGIVQSNDKVTIILGKISKEVSNKIQQLK